MHTEWSVVPSGGVGFMAGTLLTAPATPSRKQSNWNCSTRQYEVLRRPIWTFTRLLEPEFDVAECYTEKERL